MEFFQLLIDLNNRYRASVYNKRIKPHQKIRQTGRDQPRLIDHFLLYYGRNYLQLELNIRMFINKIN